MSAVWMCVCPDGMVHGFADCADGRAEHAFCGVKHEYVREGNDDDKVCDVCAVELQVFLGIDRATALAVLRKADES